MMPSAVILAGGMATRLYPLTQDIPKSLIDVNNRPFIAYQLELLKRNGFSHVVLCLGQHGTAVQAVIGDGSEFGLTIEYVYDGPQLKGTGGAILGALHLVSDPFFVLYGDSYLDIPYKKIYEAYSKKALMTVFKNDGQWDASNVIFKEGIISRYDKFFKDPDMHYIDYGLGLFSKSVFSPYTQEKQLDLAKVYQDILAQGELSAYEVFTRFYEIGSFEGLIETRAYLLKKRRIHDDIC